MYLFLADNFFILFGMSLGLFLRCEKSSLYSVLEIDPQKGVHRYAVLIDIRDS